jgi:hypothetical protein
MLACFIYLVIGTIAIQLPNIIGMQTSGLTPLQAAKIALVTLPITYGATICYVMFYGKGIEYFSYPAMSVYAKIIALVVAVVVQVLIMKSRDVNWLELAGMSICMIGFVVSVFSKEILGSKIFS